MYVLKVSVNTHLDFQKPLWSLGEVFDHVLHITVCYFVNYLAGDALKNRTQLPVWAKKCKACQAMTNTYIQQLDPAHF